MAPLSHKILHEDKDSRSSLQSPSKNQTKLHGLSQLFKPIFLLMIRKHVGVVNEKYVLDQWEAFFHSCLVVIILPFLLQSSEFYRPFGFFIAGIPGVLKPTDDIWTK